MCFSATASFGASGVIGAIGVGTIRKANPADKFFAFIPLMFATQQIFEGIIWLGFAMPQFEGLRTVATMVFLLFAWAIWPAYIPFAIASLETDSKRKGILNSLKIPGMIAGIGAIIPIFIGGPQPHIMDFHIDYTLQSNIPNDTILMAYNVMYLLCTIVPMLISSRKGMTAYGLANLIGLIIAGIFYQSSVPSTWCFFSAIFSIMIYRIIKYSPVLEQ
ncbi:MAG: DUF6629 family protein [Candidatus Kapaibacteriota bacterium]